MCYTSGTTGNPKGVVYSHRSTYLHSMAVCTVNGLDVGRADRILPWSRRSTPLVDVGVREAARCGHTAGMGIAETSPLAAVARPPAEWHTTSAGRCAPLRAVVAQVPRTSVGKYDKRVLRCQVAEGTLDIKELTWARSRIRSQCRDRVRPGIARRRARRSWPSWGLYRSCRRPSWAALATASARVWLPSLRMQRVRWSLTV